MHNEDNDPDFPERNCFESPFPFCVPCNNYFVGTFNGLLYLSRDKFLQLPIGNLTIATLSPFYASFGFGFDPKTNDYKVIRILSLALRGSQNSPPMFEVYSLSTNECRILSDSASLPPVCGMLRHEQQAFANGALHWLASRNINDYKSHCVLVFDLGDEVFCEILLPELPSYTNENANMMWTSISAYGNSIAAFQQGIRSGKLNIWVMREDGVALSWTKFSHQCLKLELAKPCPVGFRSNSEVVMRNYSGGLVSCNLDTQKIKGIEINGYFCNFVVSYVKSLVLLDKAANSVVT